MVGPQGSILFLGPILFCLLGKHAGKHEYVCFLFIGAVAFDFFTSCCKLWCVALTGPWRKWGLTSLALAIVNWMYGCISTTVSQQNPFHNWGACSSRQNAWSAYSAAPPAFCLEYGKYIRIHGFDFSLCEGLETESANGDFDSSNELRCCFSRVQPSIACRKSTLAMCVGIHAVAETTSYSLCIWAVDQYLAVFAWLSSKNWWRVSALQWSDCSQRSSSFSALNS